MTIEKLKKEIISQTEKAFEKSFGEKPKDLKLELTPDVKFGDFSVSFFSFFMKASKELKKTPLEMAEKVAGNFRSDIANAQAMGPYINIKIKNEVLFESVISEIEKEKENFGNSKIGREKKIMVEYLSPNTNKPIHLGHARNGALGMAVSNILQANGYEVIRAILTNDRGVHICKSMLAYSRWGEDETPESTGIKGDHFVGKWYVRYAREAEKDPGLEEEVQIMLRDWEEGKSDVLELWKKMNQWAYAGFRETYENYGFKFDKYYFESQTYKFGKNIVEAGLKKEVFKRDKNGAVYYDLPEEEFGRDEKGNVRRMVLIRENGTSVYLTQDLGTAVTRAREYDLARLIYIVGNEQAFHFKVLFKILSSLGYSWAKELYHLAHAMVYLPEGKMKSREGKVVDADNLLAEVKGIVAEEVGKKETKISEKEIKERSAKIALGAIKFQLLRVRPMQDIHFDPKESVAIDGFTGPYCQYAYARIAGILRKATSSPALLIIKKKEKIDYSLLGKEEELVLIQKLIEFPESVKLAAQELNPLSVATQVFEITKAFNQFYAQHQVLGAADRNLAASRLALVKATAMAIKKGLSLLGIETLERM